MFKVILLILTFISHKKSIESLHYLAKSFLSIAHYFAYRSNQRFNPISPGLYDNQLAPVLPGLLLEFYTVCYWNWNFTWYFIEIRLLPDLLLEYYRYTFGVLSSITLKFGPTISLIRAEYPKATRSWWAQIS